MDTGIMPISLDSNTIAISRGADGGCSQLSFSSKSPHPPVSRPTFPSQSNPVSASITHPDTFPQPPGVQLAIPPSPPLSAAAALTSTDQHDDSPAACTPLSTAVSSKPSSSSAKADDGPRLSPPNVINHALPSTVSSDSVPQLKDLAGYFRNEVGSDNTKRIDCLVDATQDFIQSANFDQRVFTNALGLWLDIFNWSGDGGNDDDDSEDDSGDGPSKPILRLIDLCRVYATIQGHSYFADLLYIICFAHEVEQIGEGQGRKRQVVAISETAKALGMKEKDVRALWTKRRNYMLLLRHGGPGFLLRLGPCVNTLWQQRLTEADIPLLLEHWEAHLPQLCVQARTLAPFASRILAVGVAAVGYSYDELEATESDLMESLRKNTNLQELARDTKDLTITQFLRYLEAGPASSENRIPKKRRFSDSDDARPVKRDGPLQIGESDIAGEQKMSMTVHEELEMEDMTVLWPMPGEQTMSMEGFWPEEQGTPTITGWAIPSWPMPGEPEMTDITRHLPEEVPTSTGMEPFERLGMSTMQPTQTLGLDVSMMSSRQLTTECPQTYENWVDDTQEWT